MVAFVPALSVSAKTLAGRTFLGSGTACSRTTSRVQPGKRCTVRAIMSEGGSGTDSIDFSKVNVEDAGSNLQGLVFKPEKYSDLATRVDVGYTSDQEAGVNAQINVEYTAMYAYHALWAYFDRDTVALPGFAKYFLEQSEEERGHAHDFMKYQNLRGGRVELQPLAVPEMKFINMDDGTSDALYAMDLHLQLEKFVYNKIKDLKKIAKAAEDDQMENMLDDYLTHQVEAIKQASEYVSRIRRVGTPHGVYHLDLEFRGASGN